MTRTVSVLLAVAVLAACQAPEQIHVIGVEGDHEGLAAWNADGTGPEWAMTGHATPWVTCPLWPDGSPGPDTYAYYFLAPRDFAGIDPLSPGAMHFLPPSDGFANLLTSLETNEYSVTDLTVTWGLQAMGFDQEGSEWSYASPEEERTYRSLIGGEFTIKLAGEDMVGGGMRPTHMTINYHDTADCSDDVIFGYTEALDPMDKSANSLPAVQAAAAAFLSDLQDRAIAFTFLSREPTLQQGEITGNGRAGAFYDIQVGTMDVLRPSRFTVNSNGDANDANTSDGVCDTGGTVLLDGVAGPECTLRAAIQQANYRPDVNRIHFNIPSPPCVTSLPGAPNLCTITPQSGYPPLTSPVVIDGYTQPGASHSTGQVPGIDAVLKIRLDGELTNLTHALDIRGGNSEVAGLAIFRFGNAIHISGAGGNVIHGNFLGTDVTGTATLSSGTHVLGNSVGVVIEGSQGNTVGGTYAPSRNLISGNTVDGVRIEASGASGTAGGNVVAGNFIGTDLSGTVPLGNGAHGVAISGEGGNRIGATGGTTPEGSCTGGCNIISANAGDGISMEVGANDNTVQGNRIGTDVTGSQRLGNLGNGITVTASDGNIVGGVGLRDRNIISGNNESGVRFYGATNNDVSGNFIGTDASGTADLGNIRAGVEITGQSTGNTIGGPEETTPGGPCTGRCNLIAGNGPGIRILGGSTGNLVQGNFIGTDWTGNAGIPNGHGVVITGGSSANTIGGETSSEGNVIAFNVGVGVWVGASFPNSTSNAILSNSIFSNGMGRVGIDLDDDGNPLTGGVTPNDAGDADTGANNLQNFPVLTSATGGANSITISGTLDSTAGTPFRIQFFSNSACNDVAPRDFGEGASFLGEIEVTTGSPTDPDVTFAHTFQIAIPPGQFITATATDPGDNTSEFSRCVAVG